MLNIEQHLLTVLQEEACEVGQAAAKCIRFTTDHTHPDYQFSNMENMVIEYAQLRATFDTLLENKFGMHKLPAELEGLSRSAYRAKILNISHYSIVSHKLGTLDTPILTTNIPLV